MLPSILGDRRDTAELLYPCVERSRLRWIRPPGHFPGDVLEMFIPECSAGGAAGNGACKMKGTMMMLRAVSTGSKIGL